MNGLQDAYDEPPNSAVPLLGAQDVKRPLPKEHRDLARMMPQQAIRSILYTFQFTIAYVIMLLAMYYNGYIIICIIIGAFLGSFISSWDQIGTVHS